MSEFFIALREKTPALLSGVFRFGTMLVAVGQPDNDGATFSFDMYVGLREHIIFVCPYERMFSRAMQRLNLRRCNMLSFGNQPEFYVRLRKLILFLFHSNLYHN